MLRVHAESTIVVLLQGVWDESQLAELERSEPLLARRLENVAASTRFGSGRMPGSAAQAAMTLGAPRVRHVAAWHVLLDALGEQGTPEAVTLAAHALVDAEADPFAAMTCAMASRLGWRLLRSSQPVAPAVARLVAVARPPGGIGDDFDHLVMEVGRELFWSAEGGPATFADQA